MRTRTLRLNLHHGFLLSLNFILSKTNEKLSPLVREITWSNNLLIMAGCKTDESKEFCLRLCISNGYGKREIECQIDSNIVQ